MKMMVTVVVGMAFHRLYFVGFDEMLYHTWMMNVDQACYALLLVVNVEHKQNM
jgi:hypothetical protein